MSTYIYCTYIYIYICTYTINAPTKELPLRKVRCKGHNDAGMYENMVTSPQILKGSGFHTKNLHVMHYEFVDQFVGRPLATHSPSISLFSF